MKTYPSPWKAESRTRRHGGLLQATATTFVALFLVAAVMAPAVANETDDNGDENGLIDNQFEAYDDLSHLGFSWGSNEDGQLGTGTTGGNELLPTQVLGDGLGDYFANVQEVSLGADHTLVRLNNNSLWAWGVYTYGQLGTGDNVALDVPTQVEFDGSPITNANSIAAGHHHSLVLLSDGTLLAFGKNDKGQLGLGNNDNKNEPTVVPQGGLPDSIDEIDAGEAHSIVLLDDETVWTWGDNTYGQLGDGTNIDSSTPVEVKSPSGLGLLDDIQAIAAGANHNLVLREEDDISVPGTPPPTTTDIAMAWGDNQYGQLGDHSFESRSLPDYVRDINGYTLLKVDDIAGGGDHSMLQFDNNTFVAWGRNDQGQLGVGSNEEKIPYPKRVRDSGGATLNDPVFYAAGISHSIARIGNTLYAWGSNEHGQLGNNEIGGSENQAVVVKEYYSQGDSNFPRPSRGDAGGKHSLVALESLPLPSQTGAAADSTLDGDVTVTWEAPSSQGPAGVTGYCVARGSLLGDPTGANLTTIACVGPEITSYVDDGCELVCWYNVFSMNDYGHGPLFQSAVYALVEVPLFQAIPVPDHAPGIGDLEPPHPADVLAEAVQTLVNTYCENFYDDEQEQGLIPGVHCEQQDDGNYQIFIGPIP